MNQDDAEEYTQALGQVVAGGWRQVALGERLRVPEALGLSTKEWVEQRLGGYVRMSIPERREAVAELTEEGLSQTAISEVTGVDRKTIRKWQDGDEEIPNDEPSGAEYEQVSEPLVSGDEEIPSEPQSPAAAAPLPSLEPEEPDTQPPVQLNEGDEWYTPRWLFDALGIAFSTDVCAPLNRMFSSVPADQHFTIEDDGLAQPWQGTVWCNPPYSKPEPWARRMIHHRDGLILTHIPMNAGWCVDMWETCDAIRLFQAMEFVRPDGTSQRPGYWLQLAAFGAVATKALARLQPLGAAAANKRRVASPMWRRAG